MNSMMKTAIWLIPSLVIFSAFSQGQAAPDSNEGASSDLRDAIELLTPALTALLGGLFGAERGVSKLRSQMAFTSRLEWYQKASENALKVRFAIQRLTNVLATDSNASAAEKKQAWDDLCEDTNTLLNIIPESPIYARATTYRRMSRIPYQAEKLEAITPGAKNEFFTEEERKSLNEFKSDIASISRMLTDDLRFHLGLKALSRPKSVKSWLKEKKDRWTDDSPLAHILAVKQSKSPVESETPANENE